MTEIDAARLNITLGKIQALVRDEKADGMPVMVTLATMLALVEKFCNDEDDDVAESVQTLASVICDDMEVGEAFH
jgi:hypothetical protein